MIVIQELIVDFYLVLLSVIGAHAILGASLHFNLAQVHAAIQHCLSNS